MPAWISRSGWTATKYAVLALFLLLQAYWVFVKKHDVLDIDSYPNSRPSPDISGKRTIGQTFTAEKDRLSRIEVMLGTHGRRNDKAVVFELWERGTEKRLVARKEFNASGVRNNRYHSLEFAPVAQSRGREYLFLFSSPDSTRGNSICAWMNEKDIYPKGSFMLNGRPREGDLVFRAYFKRPVAAELGRIAARCPGILGNGRFLVLVIVLLVAVEVFVLSKLLDFALETAGLQRPKEGEHG